MENSTSKLLKNIINIRKRLLSSDCSGKNKLKCLEIIARLQRQMDAYGNKWGEEGWRSFLQRNADDFDYLIPLNKSGETLKKKLYEI